MKVEREIHGCYLSFLQEGSVFIFWREVLKIGHILKPYQQVLFKLVHGQCLHLLLLIPLLLLALFISKLVPVYLLKIWYDAKTVVASGFLLTSTLSLVIAAATIGERMKIITSKVSGTLILVAVITSIFTPIVFK